MNPYRAPSPRDDYDFGVGDLVRHARTGEVLTVAAIGPNVSRMLVGYALVPAGEIEVTCSSGCCVEHWNANDAIAWCRGELA